MVGVREHTLGDSAVEGVLIEEELVLVGLIRGREHQQVEVVKYSLLLRAPVIVMEVVVNPHETLVKQLWHERLLKGGVDRRRKLHL